MGLWSMLEVAKPRNFSKTNNYIMTKIKNLIRKQGGFTLIEILVVIGIIAILATIVLIAINPALQFRKANDTQRTSNINAILNAVGQFIADNKGKLPTGIDTDVATKETISNTDADICSQLSPKYISSLPVDPDATGPVTNCAAAYDTEYKINVDANGRVTIYASGEEPAGTDNISVTR